MDQYRAKRCQNIHAKKVLIALIILLSLFFFLSPSATASAYNRRSAILLMDADSGEILYEESGGEKMEIASTTKILTAITVIENNDIFLWGKIPNEAVGVEGSSIYLRAGEKWRILDLLYGLMLRSGNDAAVALAILTSGSVEDFVLLMNHTAEKAGATESVFCNPHGLHEAEHLATARDLAKITAYALKCPIFAKICSTKTHICEKERSGVREKVTFYNKNKLLYSYRPAIGVKTGYTTHSGRCLVSAAQKGDMRLICVTLNVYDTYGVSKQLFEKYFSRLEEGEEGKTLAESSGDIV